MAEKRIENLNIRIEEPLITPKKLKELFPLSEKAISTVMTGQNTIKKILRKEDSRLLVIVGPCSIHDIESAKDYANRLKKLADELSDTLFLVMRVYFEKPRTNVGWQGLINDPYLDGSCKMEDGLKMARSLLLYCGEIGLSTATEALDQVTPQYIQDLISWTAIGARTTESQNHRKMASGFTSAVGFKNGTNGNVEIAVNAIASASTSHNFVSINPEGRVAVIRTKGNPDTHIILRGGKTPNYNKESIDLCESKIKQAGFIPNIVVDCSHANCSNDYKNQPIIVDDVARQIKAGNKSICGIMLESFINAGKQAIPGDIAKLNYGVSITDACLDWKTTEEVLRKLRKDLLD
jgi:3-deoxy-7-phosphoheptulonate synthase